MRRWVQSNSHLFGRLRHALAKHCSSAPASSVLWLFAGRVVILCRASRNISLTLLDVDSRCLHRRDVILHGIVAITHTCLSVLALDFAQRPAKM